MNDINVEDHLKLIPFFIHRKMPWLMGLYDFDDLMGEGYIALMKAKDHFDESRKMKFTTFAMKVIFQHLIDFHRREVKIQGVQHHKMKMIRRQRAKIEDVEPAPFLFSCTPVQAYQIRCKYRLGID